MSGRVYLRLTPFAPTNTPYSKYLGKYVLFLSYTPGIFLPEKYSVLWKYVIFCTAMLSIVLTCRGFCPGSTWCSYQVYLVFCLDVFEVNSSQYDF